MLVCLIDEDAPMPEPEHDDDQDERPTDQDQREAVAAWMDEHGIVCIAQDIPPYRAIPVTD
ncbi:hypothetical protein A5746_08270 [Mycolicibacterium conceptionense]|nr:hypothetical protein A5746_08270 [Mycolicibacterium conceptionense]